MLRGFEPFSCTLADATNSLGPNCDKLTIADTVDTDYKLTVSDGVCPDVVNPVKKAPK